MSLAIRGHDFNFFFGPNKAILELKNQKWVQKLTIFDQIDIHILVILVVKKVVFWTFSKLFRKFLSIVFRYLYSFPSHSRPSPLGSRGCPTLRKIRRILIGFRFYHLYDICTYSPKERFLKEPHRGVPFV